MIQNTWLFKDEYVHSLDFWLIFIFKILKNPICFIFQHAFCFEFSL